MGFGDRTAEQLTDSRRRKNKRFPLADLLRQSVYSRTAGDEDANVAMRPWQEPAIRPSGSGKFGRRGAGLSSRLQFFETDLPLQDGNLAWLATINPELR